MDNQVSNRATKFSNYGGTLEIEFPQQNNHKFYEACEKVFSFNFLLSWSESYRKILQARIEWDVERKGTNINFHGP